jgi:hypothetical protein
LIRNVIFYLKLQTYMAYKLRYIIVFLLYLFMQQYANSQQLCSGSLGDNIFLDGDFGSGVEPTKLIDPKIAPGYNYTTSVPPDGSYTITKNTGNLAGLYGSWLRVGDNSGTSDGYYMVVNASFNPGIFYEKTIDGLCGNTTYEFSADIINLIIQNPNPPHSDPNVNFLLDDVVKYTSGNIAKTGKWNTYGFTFTTLPGKTSIKLSLVNNAPGGIGNDLGLDNIKFRPCGPSSFIGITTGKPKFLCVDGKPFAVKASVSNNLKNQYLWQFSTDKITWKDLTKGGVDSIIHKTFIPGNYYYRYYSAGDAISLENSKCRVLSDAVHIEVLPQIYMRTDTICSGNHYQVGKNKYTKTGFYVDTLVSSLNCDSVIQLSLTVLPDPDIKIPFALTNPTCKDFADGIIYVDNFSGGNPPYRILYKNAFQLNKINKLAPGNYTIIVRDRFLCKDSIKVNLTDPIQFKLVPIKDTSVFLGDVLELQLKGNYPLKNISWEPSLIFSCTTCENTLATVNKTQVLKVFAENDKMCKDTLDIKVKISKDKTFFVSNIMKQNTDVNNNFIIYGYKSALAKIWDLRIYDRYGNLVQRLIDVPVKENPFVLWNGKVNNVNAASGVYTYILEVRLIDDSLLMQTGTVTVIN